MFVFGPTASDSDALKGKDEGKFDGHGASCVSDTSTGDLVTAACIGLGGHYSHHCTFDGADTL